MAKWKEDLADVQTIYDDVIRFARMGFQQYKAHLDAHPEDRGLHHVNLPNGGHQPISADSTDRFFKITRRLIAITPDNADLDRTTLNTAIRTEFVEMFLRHDRPIERSAVDKMLARALRAVRKKHREITRYLACTLVGDHEPFEFRVGAVRFLHESKFFADLGPTIDEHHRASSTAQREKAERMLAEGKLRELMPSEQWESLDRKLLDQVRDYYKPYKWIAEVTVPACDSEMSRIRAELTVQAALDLLKLFAFGWYHGERIHLGVDHGIIDRVTEVTCEKGHFAIAWKTAAYWAFAENGWFAELEKGIGGHLSAAEQMISAYLVPLKPFDITTRWLDALSWYGQALDERIPAARIVKYVAALERLTITEETPTDGDRGLTDAVTRRSALFAAGTNEDERERRRNEARELYKFRSKLMHGQRSPISKEQLISDEYRALMAKADDLARDVLIGALVEYVNLLMNKKREDCQLEERLRTLEFEIDVNYATQIVAQASEPSE